MPRAGVLGIAFAAGVTAGAVLDVLAWLVARYGPSGDGWSFRGNGALVVPLGLGPAVLAAGWTALVLRARAHRRWWAWGGAAGLADAMLVATSIALLAVFGRAAQRVSDALTVPILAWPVLAPALAAVRSSGGTHSWRRRLPHVAAALVLLVSLVASFLVAGRALPPGS